MTKEKTLHKQEIWKPVNNHYMISNLGRFAKILKHHTNKQTGYKEVSMSIDKSHKTVPIHRLVASAFIENPDNKKTVNHKDFNKLNNLPENLEWMSFKEQESHKHSVGRGIKYIELFNNKKKIIADFESGKINRPEIAKKYNCPLNRVQSMLRKHKTNKSKNSKLSINDLKEIIRLKDKGIGIKIIAEKYNISHSTIYLYAKKYK